MNALCSMTGGVLSKQGSMHMKACGLLEGFLAKKAAFTMHMHACHTPCHDQRCCLNDAGAYRSRTLEKECYLSTMLMSMGISKVPFKVSLQPTIMNSASCRYSLAAAFSFLLPSETNSPNLQSSRIIAWRSVDHGVLAMMKHAMTMTMTCCC